MTRARGPAVRRISPIARRSEGPEASHPALQQSASADQQKSCAREAQSRWLSPFSPAITPCPPTISKYLTRYRMTAGALTQLSRVQLGVARR
jgi:hypothetical protein